MADLLIKGIDLPEVYGPAILTVYECIDGHAIPREYKLSATQMQAIPPHGRLIDAEELKELFRETITGIATRTDMKGAYEHMIRASAMVIDMIDDAPTVIEASEDGEQHGKL